MGAGAPSPTAEQKRQRRERDISLQDEKIKKLRTREAIRRRRLGVSLLTGAGGETGLGGLLGNAGGAGQGLAS